MPPRLRRGASLRSRSKRNVVILSWSIILLFFLFFFFFLLMTHTDTLLTLKASSTSFFIAGVIVGESISGSKAARTGSMATASFV